MNTNWIELRYVNPWTNEESVCALTSAKAEGRWSGNKFAIFDKDSELGARIAFYPSYTKILNWRYLDAEEARQWLNATRYEHRKEIVDNFNEIYC